MPRPRSAAAAAQAAAAASASAWWKRVATTPGRTPAATSAAAASTAGRASSTPRSTGQRVGAALGRVARSFELDRRLALVGRARAAAERGDRVEQPAGRGGDRGGDAGLAHPRDRAPGGGVDARERRRLRSGRGQPRARHPPRLARGAVAAREPDRVQVAGALEAAQVAAQDLPAPHRAVRAEPGPVEDRADRRAGLAVLGEARREVGVVVLDGDVLDAFARERVGRREEVGMQVVRDDRGRDREQPLEVGDAVLERPQRLEVAEVADVRADPRTLAAREAERALELGSAREHVARGGDRQPHGRGRVAARAPQHPVAAQHRVVGARRDRPVVRQEQVGDPGQPLARVLVAMRDRLVGHVAAGHHQRLADVGQQQVVQRAVREHHPELGGPRGDRRRHPRPGAPRRDHDRPLAPGQQRRLRGGRGARACAPPPGRAPSARTASARGACARAGRRRRPRRRPGRRGGIRRRP